MTTKSTSNLSLKLRKATAEDFVYRTRDDHKRYRYGMPYLVDQGKGKWTMEIFSKGKRAQQYFTMVFNSGLVYLVENTDGAGAILQEDEQEMKKVELRH